MLIQYWILLSNYLHNLQTYYTHSNQTNANKTHYCTLCIEFTLVYNPYGILSKSMGKVHIPQVHWYISLKGINISCLLMWNLLCILSTHFKMMCISHNLMININYRTITGCMISSFNYSHSKSLSWYTDKFHTLGNTNCCNLMRIYKLNLQVSTFLHDLHSWKSK